MWHKNKPSYKKTHVFRSTIYVHGNNDQKLGNRSFPAVWLGYRLSTAILLYWDSFKKIYDRCHHGCIDEYTFQVKADPAHLLFNKYIKKYVITLTTVHLHLERVTILFTPKSSFSYSFTIPLSGLLGLTWKNDIGFGIQLIVRISSDSSF